MLDFIFRRGNITNHWQRDPNLQLSIDLARATINGIELGNNVGRLEFLGRSSNSTPPHEYPYRDLGLAVEVGVCGESFTGFHVIFDDDAGKFQPFAGALLWNNERLKLPQLPFGVLPTALGAWYWLDVDDGETIAFYELPRHELQVEFDSSGKLKWITVTKEPVMADASQRAAYGVDKAWPPQDIPKS